MAYFRSHWIFGSDCEPMNAIAQAWQAEHSSKVPGFSGLWIVPDLDLDDFEWITLEFSTSEGLADGGVPEVRSLTAQLAAALGGEVRSIDSEDVSYYEADRWEDTSTKVYHSMWFNALDPDLAASIIGEWQRARVAEGRGVERTWLVRGLVDRTIHSISAQFDSRRNLDEYGVPAFHELLAQVAPLMTGDPEIHNATGGVQVAGE